MNPAIQKLWRNYYKLTPSIKKVKTVLKLKDYSVFCDHIAFRTISTKNHLGITNNSAINFGMERMSQHFIDLGFIVKQQYYFEEKKLKAIHLEKKNHPKIFISELILNECSFFLRNTMLNAFKKLEPQNNVLIAGRNWNVNYNIYQDLLRESEYAAWLYVYGHRVNHFTLSVNKLKGYSIENVCAQLRTHGVELNNFEGVIKGNSKIGLKQASTMADEVSIKFEDVNKTVSIPSCYVEFAERFIVNNKMFNGFITKSADKIFQSTNKVA